MQIKNLEDIGKIIKETRVKQKMTQKDLALICNTSPRLIVELENGKRATHFTTIIKICSMLGLKINIQE